MDSHYSDSFLADRKADLLRQKQELETELHRIARFDEAAGGWVALQPEFSPDSSEDSGEMSEESETQQTNRARVTELETTQVEVDAALGKLADGTYGKCETTGEWMNEDRLIAYPAARTCGD